MGYFAVFDLLFVIRYQLLVVDFKYKRPLITNN